MRKVSRFLFKYRVTPHSTTGVPPAELMFGRQLRTTLDLLQPSIGHNVRQSQTKQKEGHDAHSKSREFAEGDTVFVKCFNKADTWLPGVIDRKQGPVSYRVVLDDDRVVRRHFWLGSVLLIKQLIRTLRQLRCYLYQCLNQKMKY